MSHNYTRQRQGRDFTFHDFSLREKRGQGRAGIFRSLLEEVNYLRNAELSVEGNYNNIDGLLGNAPLKDDYEAKTLLEQIEYNKAVSERNAVPVDGNEPPQERSATERMR